MTSASGVVAAQSGVRELAWRGAVAEAIRAWPQDVPLACVVSGGTPGEWSRWSILAAPDRAETLHGPGALSRLGLLLDAGRSQTPEGLPPKFPFTGGWIGSISYDLGREIEPTAQAAGAADDRGWARAHMCRCNGALVHDSLEGRWWSVGDVSAVGALGEAVLGSARVGEFTSDTGRVRYEESVRRALELIASGDVFQVNLAHRLSAAFDGRPRELAARLLESAQPWFGAWIEHWEGAVLRGGVLSLSPELFLSAQPQGRRVVTRPIKGTRPAGTDSGELLNSEKDRAELTMIVDLMRNDLGRVCEFGSVRVERDREIEAHAGVIHGVATVSGRLCEGVGQAELLRAAFPPGSVTGAPKVRAMQIIDELEPSRRGPYCGSVGFVSDHGRACWNVAIRTATLTCDAGSTVRHARGTLDYSVGAGIVADSIPEAEWAETLSKAGMLAALGPMKDPP